MIIGLTGRAGAGKDTAADYLVSRYGFTKLSMATPLKAGLAAMGFPEPGNRFDKEKQVPGFDFTWRQAAQALGTEFGRSLDPDIWVKSVAKILMENPDKNFVISDIRFDNEGEMIARQRGEVWYILGREADLGEAASHSSEAGVSDALINTWLKNDMHLSDLFDLIDWTMTNRGMEKAR